MSPSATDRPQGGSRFLFFSMALVMGILLLASIARHKLFQSTALDLGWFDQAIYLISQGLPPIVSFSGVHILGDHAALTVYPLALFYKLLPSVYWLLFLQAGALAIAAWPLWQLAQQLGLSLAQTKVFIWVYFLYPLIFNLNLFDFHTEVLALPALFLALWAVRAKKTMVYSLAILFILASKAVLSLTVTFLGLWLILEKRRLYGFFTLVGGIAWFIISTKLIIPGFSGREAGAVARYSYLGNSVLEILQNLVLKPQLFLGQLFTADNAFYLLLLVLPVLWAIVPNNGRTWAILIPAFPAFFVNLITPYLPQKDLIHQYSLSILPFLILFAMTQYQQGRTWLKRPRWLLLWSIITFLLLAKYTHFLGLYQQNRPHITALETAIALVEPQKSVLTAPNIAPHLTHRPQVQLAIKENELLDPLKYEVILLNQANPGWPHSQETVDRLIHTLRSHKSFKLTYEAGPIFLFSRSGQGP